MRRFKPMTRCENVYNHRGEEVGQEERRGGTRASCMGQDGDKQDQEPRGASGNWKNIDAHH